MTEATVEPLERPLADLPGVGTDRARQLARLKLNTVGDLLLHRPRRHEDRRNIQPLATLNADTPALGRGVIVVQGLKRLRRGRTLFEFVLGDSSGRVHCRWWNLPFMERYFNRGDEVLIYGKLSGHKPPTLDHPETEIIVSSEETALHLNRITPVYPLTDGITQRWLRRLIWRVLETQLEHVENPDYDVTPLPSRPDAVRVLHFPNESGQADEARRRLALDEFIYLQTSVRKRRETLQAKATVKTCPGNGHLFDPFLKQLAFPLTGAQQQVLDELAVDLRGHPPMRRLLQGDVGSGKTVVAAGALLRVLESGYNALLMAPTEILAEQHARTFRQWLEPVGITVQMQTGSRHEAEGGPSLFNEKGRPTLVVGTHALIQERFQLERIGLVVIDEQHKFGVEQRNELLRKGDYPHLLVMTATPIPRTLGLTLYGDLDLSVINEMPPGRGEVKTHLRCGNRRKKIIDFVCTQLNEGRQAYVVYPRVEHAEPSIKAVTQEAAQLREVLAPHAVGVLHGRLKSDHKESVMRDFREGHIDVLLSTTVIEVGVDVPNATVMLVENAERFGLAQLHQLRGRIGRGTADAHFIMILGKDSTEARERLSVLEETHDGFAVAEADLKQRGPGDFLGQEQSGLPPFQFGDLRSDLELIERARAIVAA
ncbi:MAG: ATP-dependent DNA helicase RecG [Verrucomicrobiota bacterium]|nr:ATP-dependent DNA helicase RecG [Verrucomicrobiota bacterium]